MTTLRSDTGHVDASIGIATAEVTGTAVGTGVAEATGEVHSTERPAAPPAPARRPATLAAAGELLRALAAPVRIAIVLQLRESERCVHELVEALQVTQPLISQHLRVLKAAGVVAGERHGREVVYRLVDEHLAHIVMDAVAHAEEGS
jgi:DNA-binding transcriptional ArsR family regulator